MVIIDQVQLGWWGYGSQYGPFDELYGTWSRQDEVTTTLINLQILSTTQWSQTQSQTPNPLLGW